MNGQYIEAARYALREVIGLRRIRVESLRAALLLIATLAAAQPSFAGTFTVFGKETVTRATKAPVTASFSFDVRDPSARYEIRVLNGAVSDDKGKKTQTSSARIAINGAQVIGPNYFNKNVTSIVEAVALDGANSIDITPAGQPGSYLTVDVIGYDDVPPEITAYIEPVANRYGWHNGSVVVRFECDDKTSGVAFCAEPVTLELEGENQTVTGMAVDIAGNQARTTVTVNIDLTKGLIQGAITPSPNAAGWNNSDATVSFSCSDALSGVASCSEAVLLNTESADHSVAGEVIDRADNSATTNVTVRLDKTAPQISVSPTPVANDHGWHNGPVKLHYSCSDSLSGVAACEPDQTIAGEGAAQTITGDVTDAADNSATTDITLNIDLTAPTIASTIFPAANAAGWHNQDVMVSYSCDDALSGVQQCEQAKIVTTEEANQIISGSVTDNADNGATTSLSLNIDKTAPLITTTLEPLPNAAGWHNEAVLVRFHCSDELSGIASCPEPVTLELEGGSQPVSGTAVDVAGNAASTTVSVNIDLTPGLISGTITPAPNAAGWNNADATVNFTCSDALSGVAACTDPVPVSQESASNVVTGQVVDKADNQASATATVTVKLDKSAPQISVRPTPAANSLGWQREPVTLTYTCSDSLSGIAECTPNQVIQSEGANQKYTGQAVDIANNDATTDITLNIDRTAPTIAETVTPVANAAGWHNSDVTVSYSCNDALSGVQSCADNVVITTEAASQVITGEVVDNADNPASTSVTLNIDKTAPEITTTLEPLPNEAGWHKEAVLVRFHCSDALSGIATCPEPVTLSLEGAAQEVSGTAVDVAGNSASTTVSVNIDLTPGLIAGEITPAPNAAGWNNADATVSFTCSDALSGVASCSESQSLQQEGAQQTVTGTVADTAGNSASTTLTLNIDKTAPEITTTLEPLPNEAGWHKEAVLVRFHCSDTLSGIATCPEPVTLSLEGGAQEVSGTAVDVAGNSASTTVSVNIDLTPGLISGTITPAPNAAGWSNADATVSFTCSDALSGVASCTDPQSSQQEGAQQAVTGTVIDTAGNSASTTLTLNIDKTAPEISTSLEPLPNEAGWHKEAVLVRFHCSDALSGIATCPEPVTLNLEGGAQEVSGTAVDVAGNSASTTVSVNIDLTPGLITGEITPPPNAAGWNNADATVSFTCNDALSGVASCTNSQTQQQEGAQQAVTGTVVDAAGNSASTTLTLNIDRTAPEISTSLEPLPNEAGWHKEAVLVRFHCSDTLSGIATCPEPVTLSLEGGAQEVSGTAIDVAGNSTRTTVNVNIDLTPGLISGTITPAPNAAGWNNADATVDFTCSDALSGVASCSESQSLQQEGAQQTVTGTVVDTAGNSASTALTIKIDKTAPTLSFDAPQQGSAQTVNPPPVSIKLADNLQLDGNSLVLMLNGSPVSATCQLSGDIANCTLPVYIDGNNATIEARVRDMAGNEGSAAVSFDFDNDGDGHVDAEDLFPDDATEWADMDGDGTGDNSDPDRDGDGISNDYETQTGFDPNDAQATPPDTDSDGIPNSVDPDRDGDGVANEADAFPDDPAESSDLDGDGIGDNADPDRDGDGFSNTDEQAEGTDPNNAADYPDHEPPALTVDGGLERVTDADTMDLGGTVSDSGKGVATVKIATDRYAGIDFAALLSGDRWSASVPLEVDTNLLTITATDKVGNQAAVTVNVLREDSNAVVGLTIDYPKANAILTTDSIVVRGVLRSSLPAQSMTVQVNGKSATLSATDNNTDFTFQSGKITLAEGINNILVQGTVDDQPIQRTVYVTYQPEEAQVAAPVITVLAPQNGSYLAESDFMLAGEVIAEGRLTGLAINGQAVAFSTHQAPRYPFSELQNIPDGDSSGTFTIVATDELGKQSETTVEYPIDNIAPRITLERPLNPAPQETLVVEQPYRLQGTVSDPNIASLLINDTGVSLEPLDTNGNYRFDVPLALARGEPNPLTLSASDMAGNSTPLEYRLRLDTILTLKVLSPLDGTQYFHQGEPIDLNVNAQVDGLSGLEGVVVTAQAINGAGEVVVEAPLSGSSSLMAGTLELPGITADYRLSLNASDSAGKQLAATAVDISVLAAQDIPLELVRQEPANAAEGIESNVPVALYFNQPVDTTRLTVKVYETAHGYTYEDRDPPGTDALAAKGYQLVEVHRDHEAVAGGLSLLPNNRTVVFYPERELAYNADIYVDVSYDGSSLSRTQYHTRPLPTFIVGAVHDQLGQGIGGLEVLIPELGRTTVTNKEGAFTFGFGDTAAQNIPGGRYRLLANPGMKDRRYGTASNTISVEEGRRNNLPNYKLPLLARDVPFVPAAGGEHLVLLQGNLKLDLTGAQLLFPDGRRSGDIHAQFTSFSQLPYAIDPIAMPLWMYSVQPSGLSVSGSVGLDFACPPLNGSLDYVPMDGAYVLLLGLQPEARTIAPVGVGQVENRRIKSVGKLHYPTLEMIGFGLADEAVQPSLKAYAEGKISLPMLLLQLRQ